MNLSVDSHGDAKMVIFRVKCSFSGLRQAKVRFSMCGREILLMTDRNMCIGCYEEHYVCLKHFYFYTHIWKGNINSKLHPSHGDTHIAGEKRKKKKHSHINLLVL